MDFGVMQNYWPLYQKALYLTLKIGWLGILFAVLTGFLCALIQYLKVPVIRKIVSVYIEISRNTPLLIQLFFIYYGLPKMGLSTDAATCGVFGLAFLGGSYMAESLRSGIESVDRIQSESAYSLGMNSWQVFIYT